MLRSRMLLVLVTGIVLGVSLSLTANVIAGRETSQSPPSNTLAWEDARLLAEVLRRIETDYVEPIGDHELMENAVRGMVAGLDSHSAYLDRDEYEEMQASTAGSYPGIGIEVTTGERGVEVLRPIEGAPAAVAGMRAGDVIIGIDGVDVTKEDVDQTIARLRGRAGTTVRINVRREGVATPLAFNLRRTQVEVHSVSSQMLEPGYGYLRIVQFSETTSADVRSALADLQLTARELKGLVIDLRNNPGGLLDSAVEIADDFLESGNIVSAEGRSSDARFRMDARAGDLLKGAPITVLVNGGSASAAEILAGALRDNRRATLIGRKTYGKGSVQTVMPLSEGRALKITTSRYFTPSGASINEVGLQPDVPYAGEDLPPAHVDQGAAPLTLSIRDAQVRLALDTLKGVTRRLAGSLPQTH
ncbi:MAG: S41 family peptidase [Pseudomonadota bacterium]